MYYFQKGFLFEISTQIPLAGNTQNQKHSGSVT